MSDDPTPSPSPQLKHRVEIESTRDFALGIHIKTDDGAIGHLIRALVRTGTSKQLRQPTREVYMHLAAALNGRHLAATGECFAWLKHSTLESRTGFGRSTIYAAITELKAWGLIQRARRNVPTGDGSGKRGMGCQGRLFEEADENWRKGYLIFPAQEVGDGPDAARKSRQRIRRKKGRPSAPSQRIIEREVNVQAAENEAEKSTAVDKKVHGGGPESPQLWTKKSTPARADVPAGGQKSPPRRAPESTAVDEKVHSDGLSPADTLCIETTRMKQQQQRPEPSESGDAVAVSAGGEDGDVAAVYSALEAQLIDIGVEDMVARRLARSYPAPRIAEVMACARWRRERGKCDNPGGFVRDALTKKWTVSIPPASRQGRDLARQRGDADLRAERAARAEERSTVADERARIEAMIHALSDEQLAGYAAQVLAGYADSPVPRVLTDKPARECWVMKTKIAALLEAPARRSHEER